MIGEQIGEYRIVSVIAQGGMATVYKAYQPSFERFVAIKVLPPQSSEDPTFLKRFQHEARVIAQLEHRAILPVYAYGEHNGMPYLVMRLMEGGSLRRKLFYERIDLLTAVRIVEQVAEALDYAHAQGVVHRDLKPSNILLDELGNAYLTDFGIAKILGSATHITGEGVVGTPTYMSPEQCQGKEVTPASDIYALGVILFEMVTGTPPFEADTPLGVMYKHVREPIPSVTERDPSLPPALDHVIRRAMAKRPQERYPTAMALAADFRRAVEAAHLEPQAEEVLPLEEEEEKILLRSEEEPFAEEGEGPLPAAPRRPLALTPLLATLLTIILGLAVVMGAVGVGLVIFSWMSSEWRTALAPTLPPTWTPGPSPVAEITNTPLIIVIPGDTPTPTATEMTGGIIEPSPRPSETPLFTPTTAPTLPKPPSVTPSPPPPAPTATPTATPLPPTPTNTLPPAPAPGRLAFTQGVNENAEIAVMNGDGSGLRTLTNNTVYDGEPDWSPDGTQIAFESSHGGNFDLYIMNADGSNVRQLTTSERPDRHPDWSPDGRLIVYESGLEEESEIYVINADGSGRTRLTRNDFGDRAPHFSPDGTQIAYMTMQRGKWEIAIMAYPSGALVAIFNCPAAHCRFPAWSPDGKSIAYNTQDSAGRVADIWVLDVASGRSTRLIEGSESGRPAWSGDGLSLYFNRTVRGNTDLYRFDFATGALTRLTTDAADDYGPDWGKP